MTESKPVSKRWLASYNKRIREENAWFKGLTKPQKRVQIALDVLTQIRAKRIVPESGTYFEGVLSENEIEYTEKTDMQEILSKTETCTACAVGSLFVCAVERFDKLKAEDCLDDEYDWSADIDEQSNKLSKKFDIEIDRFDSYLQKFFSSKQLGMMEAAFEGGFHHWEDDDSISAKEKDAARFFFHGTDLGRDYSYSTLKSVNHQRHQRSEARLRLIMENLVANNGTFNPFKKPVRSRGKWVTPDFHSAKSEFVDSHY